MPQPNRKPVRTLVVGDWVKPPERPVGLITRIVGTRAVVSYGKDGECSYQLNQLTKAEKPRRKGV